MRQLVPGFILENVAAGRMAGSFTAAGLFVDTSGFSAMTESLMAHGLHGAEVLAGVMRATFEPLFLAVFEQSGFIITQEGDAFTALFPIMPGENGPEAAALRALAAASRMQRQAAASPSRSTPYGDFAITLKIGLAAGEAAWGVVTSADKRRAAYYFRGSAVEGCAQAEHLAAAGDMILSPEFLAAVQGQVLAEPVNGYYRLIDVRGTLPAAAPYKRPAPDPQVAGLFYPPELYTQKLTGEFRQVAYLFISLPTVRSETQLNLFMQTVFELLGQYGGLLKLFFGDKGAHLMAFWGAPVAYENNIERALNFVLELQSRTAIPINGGVTYRMAHAGFIGSDLAEDFTAFGPGANLAARFMAQAPRGEIWVDEHIARRVGNQYELEEGGERRFKGFARPQKYFLLLDRKDETRDFFSGALVGREAELEQLRQFVQPIFAGTSPGILIVWGEPGIGKSRLVHEFLLGLEQDRPGAFQHFLGQSDEILRQPLNPFRYWLRRYFQVSDQQGETRNKRSFNRVLDNLIGSTADPRLASELDRTRSFLGALVELYWPDSLYEQLDAKGRRENTLLSLVALLQAESLRLPVIFFLEDAHLLDDESKAFLPRLVRTLSAHPNPAYPIAILATARFEGAGLPLDEFPYQQVNLDRLQRPALSALAAGLLGGPASEALLDLLEDQTEGNPFFAEQMLRYLQEEKRITFDAHSWRFLPDATTPLPVDVGAVLIARLDRLARDVREIVQTASVLGREFEVSLLGWMLGGQQDDSFMTKVIQAEREAIWVALSELRYIFTHALMRTAAYQMQLLAHRQALHALALEAYETLFASDLKDHVGALAYHAEQAGLDHKARIYLQEAGQAAKNMYQNRLAAEYFTRALKVTPEGDMETQFELLVAREEVDTQRGALEERRRNLAALEKLVSGLESPEKRCELLLRKSSFALDTSAFAEASRLAKNAIELARSIHLPDKTIRAYKLLVASQMRQSQFDQAVQAAQEGLALARQAGVAREEGSFFNMLGLIALEQGRLDTAQDYLEQSLAIAREVGVLRDQALPLNNLGMVAGYKGDFAAAQNYYEQSLQISQKIGDRAAEGLVSGNLGWIAGNLGEYRKARSYAETNARISLEVGDLYTQMYALINLSGYSSALGDYQAAEQYARQGYDLARRTGDRSGEAWAWTYLGHCQIGLNQPAAAALSYQEALAIRRELVQPLLATEPQAGLARAALCQGNLAAAVAHFEPVLDYLNQHGDLDGTDEPLRVYLTGFLVLQATGDPRAAGILETAYQVLQNRAASIPNETSRQQFLNQVACNKEILAAWENEQRRMQ